MVIQIYYTSISSPSRIISMILKILRLEYEIKEINLFTGEQKKPEYLAVNPRGKVPALKDGSLIIAESRAIATYLCNQYEQGDDSTRLYPVDPKKRALVDQMLYVSVVTKDMLDAYVNIHGVIRHGEGPAEDKLIDVHDALKLQEGYLTKNEYIAGSHITLADYFMMSPHLTLGMTSFNDYDNYPKISSWLKLMKALPYFDECVNEGLEKIKAIYQGKLNKSKA